MKHILLLFTVSVSLKSFGQSEDFQALSEKIINLRHEVETLSRSQDQMQRQRQMEVDALSLRKSELVQQLRKERLRDTQLRAKTEALRKDVQPLKVVTRAEKDLIASWLADLQDWVQRSLPFRREDRLNSVKRIEARFVSGESPERILSEIWSFVEKELKLTHDNAFEIMEVKVSEKPQKSEVVRIGMMQLLYRTPAGETGFARNVNGQWTMGRSQTEAEDQAIVRLITRLKDQQGRGFFEVPGISNEVVQ